EPGEDIDVVVDGELARHPLGDVGRARVVTPDDLDLAARDRVAMLLDVELDRVVHLRRRVRELARIGQDQPDLERLLGACGRCPDGRRHATAERDANVTHDVLPAWAYRLAGRRRSVAQA